MKLRSLQQRLLAAIFAVSVAAIILCIICFAVMLRNITADATERGRQTNNELIDIVMDGFVQTEGMGIDYLLNAVRLSWEGESFGNDEALLRHSVAAYQRLEEYNRVDQYFFIARDGQVTAALLDISLSDDDPAVAPGEMTRLLEDSRLTEALYTEDPETVTTLPDLLSLDHAAGGAFYSKDIENLPMMLMITTEDEGIFGVFFPSATSKRIYEALGEVSEEYLASTEAALAGMARRYFFMLTAAGVALALLIVFFSVKLSGTIAKPVEREKQLLEEVNRLKSEFLANVSHELKTPLTVISSYAQENQKALGAVPEAAAAERDMRLIASEADRLALMVGQVLDVSQIDEGRMVLNPRETSVMRLVQDAMDTYYPVFRKNNNTLRIEPATLPPIRCDATRVTQVLVNLVSNAAKHTRNGTITISTTQQQDMVRISVADTGEGISPEGMKTLFERYRTKKAPGDTGTGLGLFISRYIVEAHGGSLTIESEVGKGTIASFTLPVDAPVT